jgi:hypothetical protein
MPRLNITLRERLMPRLTYMLLEWYAQVEVPNRFLFNNFVRNDFEAAQPFLRRSCFTSTPAPAPFALRTGLKQNVLLKPRGRMALDRHALAMRPPSLQQPNRSPKIQKNYSSQLCAPFSP